MSRDPDEDSSSPTSPHKPAPKPVAVSVGGSRSTPAPPPTTRLVWGICGVHHEVGELKAYPGQYGVSRFVSGGVGYTTPPLGPLSWRASTEEPGRYEIPWDGNPGAARTLEQFRKELDQAAGQLKHNANHPLLNELNQVAIGLASLASHLHRDRWSLGLIRPDNILLKTTPEGLELVPVDLGFAWRGSFGPPPWDDSPGRPDWLNVDQKYRWLWGDEPPVRRQMADPNNGVYPPADPGADVRILGRLLAWLVGGQESEVVSELRGQRPYWKVFVDAAAGNIPDAETLAQRLRENPPGDHFAQPVEILEPIEERGRTSWWLYVICLIGLTALAGGAIWMRSHSKSVTTAPTTEEQNNETPANYAAALAQFEDAIKQSKLAEAVKSLIAAYKGAGQDGAAKLAPQRAEFLKTWKQQYQDTVKLAGDPVKRFEAGRQFADLHTQLNELIRTRPATDPAQRTEEEQWLTAVKSYIGLLPAQPR